MLACKRLLTKPAIRAAKRRENPEDFLLQSRRTPKVSAGCEKRSVMLACKRLLTKLAIRAAKRRENPEDFLMRARRTPKVSAGCEKKERHACM
ncbi:hypothetical protein C3V36_01550 [Lachnospiraceae bacterium oral taxon 500]|nr:hypothetical protein C3V36_01550 [Lachnospiraceae bacterium oral taxon 500]